MVKKQEKKKPYLPKDGSEAAHPLLIPLQNYELRHNTFKDEDESNDPDSDFIGRESLITQLHELLKNTKKNRGSYLVAGYRGSGKTSLINRVIKKYIFDDEIHKNVKEKKLVLPVRINLGHDEVLDTRHVLFNIISSLRNEFRFYFEKTDKSSQKIKLLLALIVIIFVLYFFLDYSNVCQYLGAFCFKVNHLNISSLPTHKLLYASIIFLLILALFSLEKFRGWLMDAVLYCQFESWGNSKYHCYKLINKVYKRVAYSLEKEVGLLNIRSGIGFRNKTIMPEIKEPQIELELINILDQCHQTGFDIILIFDELDKISLTVTESNLIDVNNPPEQNAFDLLNDETLHEHAYRRKKRVDALLASLKTLITVGKARFFFIAGRDMLDSYQSEKGSTSSLYESLFNQVFEVPSFLTDDSDQDKIRLHSMIEVYVCSRLLKQDTSYQYFLVNKIWEDVLKNDDLSQLLKNINAKITIGSVLNNHNKFFFKYLSQYKTDRWENFLKRKRERKRNIIKIEIIKKALNAIEKYIKTNLCYSYRFIDSKKLINSLTKENDEYEQQLLIQKSIRQWLIKNWKELEEHLAKYLELDGNKERKFLYKASKINTYYLYLIDNGVSKNDSKVVANKLRYFVNYLTVHSWGNCKRLASLFESFTKPYSMADSIPNAMNWLPADEKGQGEKAQYMLHFGVTETQRISMGSNLYIMFNHHLSRQFTGADKLVVSTLAALHYCLKFHRSAFSRHHLARMTEMMSIYSSPELNSIFETTLTQVLWPYIRVIRNGMFRYRFFTWIEQEIRYIARVNDLESASYTFSLDAINDIKAHYRKTLSNVMDTYQLIQACSKERGPGLIAEINIVLGDIYFLERSYDEAVVYYQTAVNAHHNLNQGENYHLECLLRFVEALLKLGSVQEHRQRYERAAMNYHQAMRLVDVFISQDGQHASSSMGTLHHDPFRTMKQKDEYKKIDNYLKQGDAKWVLLKQPCWAFLYLNTKRGNANTTKIIIPENLYDKKDPYGDYHQAQLCFYLGRYEDAEEAYIRVITKFDKAFCSDDKDKDKFKQYYGSYLIPKACINLAHNSLAKIMKDLTGEFSESSKSWEECRTSLTKKCWDVLKTMKDVKNFSDLEVDGNILELNLSNLKIKEVLQLIFYAAKQYEKYKLFDHAAMAYLKAISLWVIMFDMLPLNYLEDTRKGEDQLSEQREGLFNLANAMYQWLDEASNNALQVIMDSNGQAVQQAREKWYFRDLGLHTLSDLDLKSNSISYKEIEKLHTNERREELNDDIEFWRGSYLGQQLIAMLNWAYTIKRTLAGEDPSPIKSYRMPLYTTRSLILSSWANGRERLEQARRYRIFFELERELKFVLKPSYSKIHKCGNSNSEFFKCGKIVKKLTDDLNKKDKENGGNGQLLDEECYYIISAKVIHNFYTALHYTRILVDNNQAIIIPPSGFIILNLWRCLYRLVEYEKARCTDPYPGKNRFYEASRILVRDKLMKYVSSDIPTSHLDLDYAAGEAVRQLRALSTMGNSSSTARFNILHNKFYLNDDFEDPGFQLDWTMVQMLIPSSIMLIKWVQEEMDQLKKKSDYP